MPAITQSVTREIVDDFAEEIRKRQTSHAKPSKWVINFRNEIVDKYERDIVKVPIRLLRFRKDNGRIASDVLDYEYTKGPLDESDEDTQNLLREFLEKKDPEKTSTLKNNIQHSGQREPAIITCDGFLIDGNRRKMVLDQLCENDEQFKYMNVVILPGKDDEGGPPTLLEIEELENRYQLQSQGKAEYYGFDRALSIKRKIDIGLTLEKQIRDDPEHTNATKSEIQKAIKDIEKNYLEPLKCAERYLKQFGRDKQYHTISTGKGDREGRWQAFIDYSNTYNTKFKNKNYQIESGIEEDEIGDIEEAAFDIIRLRSIPDMPKIHAIMRNLHKYCSDRDSRKEILSIPKRVDVNLPSEQEFEGGDRTKPLSRQDVDAKWSTENKEAIIFHLKRASKNYESKREKETPIDLLDAALKKLTHKGMDLSAISIDDYDKARKLAVKVKDKALSLEKEIYGKQKHSRRSTKKKVK